MGLILFSIAVIVVIWLFKKFNKPDDEFSLDAQGIPYEKGLPFFGNILPLLLMREGGIQFFERMYETFNHVK